MLKSSPSAIIFVILSFTGRFSIPRYIVVPGRFSIPRYIVVLGRFSIPRYADYPHLTRIKCYALFITIHIKKMKTIKTLGILNHEY